MNGQRSARDLGQLAAGLERSEVDTEEAELVDRPADDALGLSVVARMEQDAATAVGRGIVGQQLRRQVVERLHDLRARDQAGEDLAGQAAAEVRRLELRRF